MRSLGREIDNRLLVAIEVYVAVEGFGGENDGYVRFEVTHIAQLLFVILVDCAVLHRLKSAHDAFKQAPLTAAASENAGELRAESAGDGQVGEFF